MLSSAGRYASYWNAFLFQGDSNDSDISNIQRGDYGAIFTLYQKIKIILKKIYYAFGLRAISMSYILTKHSVLCP